MLALSVASCHGIDWFLILVLEFSCFWGWGGLSLLVQLDGVVCLGDG